MYMHMHIHIQIQIHIQIHIQAPVVVVVINETFLILRTRRVDYPTLDSGEDKICYGQVEEIVAFPPIGSLEGGVPKKVIETRFNDIAARVRVTEEGGLFGV